MKGLIVSLNKTELFWMYLQCLHRRCFFPWSVLECLSPSLHSDCALKVEWSCDGIASSWNLSLSLWPFAHCELRPVLHVTQTLRSLSMSHIEMMACFLRKRRHCRRISHSPWTRRSPLDWYSLEPSYDLSGAPSFAVSSSV